MTFHNFKLLNLKTIKNDSKKFIHEIYLSMYFLANQSLLHSQSCN